MFNKMVVPTGSGSTVKIETGTETSGTTSVTLPWKPDYLVVYGASTGAQGRFVIDNYISDWSTTQFYEQLSEHGYTYNLNITNAYGLCNVTDSGFTVGSNVGAFSWMAIKF